MKVYIKYIYIYIEKILISEFIVEFKNFDFETCKYLFGLIFISEINNSIISIHKKDFISYDNLFIFFFLVSIKNNRINT